MDAINQSLFRKQALLAARSQTFGGTVLVRPLSFAVLTSIAVVLALATCAFLVFGSYTQRSTVGGQLVSEAGLVKIYAPQAGIVLERHVTEGQTIKAGDVLFVVSSERSSASQGATQAAISSKVQEREASLTSEIDKTRILQINDRQSLELKLDGLQAELATLDTMSQDQRDRVQLAKESLARYQALKAKDMISSEQLQQRTAELLDQRTRLEGVERDGLSVKRDLGAAKAELAGLSLKHQNVLSEMARLLASTSQELIESEAKRRLVLSAPQAGTATAVLANVGQSVDGSRPLVSIVPTGAIMHAELYAPSRAMGFVRPGDPVLIRYQAFPYQKFGHQKGSVESVARTALPTSELAPMGVWTDTRDAQPLYRITVKLRSQSVLAYGQAQALQSGMLLDADILQERRRLYEWVLEPLYSLSGKF
jgi:membrane fusion protein